MKIPSKEECMVNCKPAKSKLGESRATNTYRNQVLFLHSQGDSVESILWKLHKLKRNPPYEVSDNPLHLPRINALCKQIQKIIDGTS